jgi:hypothetical protein
MKRGFLFYSAFVLLAAGTACNHGDAPSPDPAPGRVVKKLVASESDYQAYTFNGNNQLSDYTVQWQSSQDHTSRQDYHFEYEGRKVIRVTNQGGGRVEYHYTGNRIISADNYASNGRKLSTHEFSYDPQGRVKELVEKIESPQDIAELKFVLAYHSDGNLKTITHLARRMGSQQFLESFTQFFEAYDKKNQPVASMLLGHYLPGIVLHKNNPLKMKTLMPDGSTERTLVMEYQYDNEGYPSSRKQHIEMNGQSFPALEYTYIY